MKTQQVNSTRYSVFPSQNEFGSTYGIRAVNENTGETLSCVDDVCPNEEALTHLARRLEECEVDPIHLMGIVEDFLESIYG